MAQNKLSIEQLISLAKKPLKEKPKKQTGSMIDKFIQEEKLNQGTTRISDVVVYDRYYKWCDINNINPVSIIMFNKECRVYFPKVTNNKGTFYVLSSEGFNISLENAYLLKNKYKGKGIPGAKKKKSKVKEKSTSS